MRLTRITTAKKEGFRKKSLHNEHKHRMPSLGYLKRKSSFAIAILSLFAFIAGNMVGEHGWYAFWASVLGGTDDDLIEYAGTVTPLELVPDYAKWAKYGGDPWQHSFSQVPNDALIPLPRYDASAQKLPEDERPYTDIYSVGHMGDYKTGTEGHGTHVGVDIRVPVGTPVRSIANGVVTQVREDSGGFGLLIVIRHPHMPDPDKPSKETVLHSVYAHLSAQFVSEGDIVRKGQQIGLSGKSGFATGPHLHFQIDRDSAPWHPYWPFSTAELREAGISMTQAINTGFHSERGYENTVHPMLTAQANLPAAPRADRAVATAKTRKTPIELRAERKQRRLVALGNRAPAPATTVAAHTPTPAPVPSEPVATTTVATAQSEAPRTVAPACQPVATIDFQHDRSFSGREWERLRVTLLDATGAEVDGACLSKPLLLRTAYGEAQYRLNKDASASPTLQLTAAHFQEGSVTLEFLPLGRKTVVILADPFGVLSQPSVYKQ